MDDHPISAPTGLTVIRCCETNRLQEQLLAQAYQQVFPQVRRPLADARMPMPTDRPMETSTAARVAAGA